MAKQRYVFLGEENGDHAASRALIDANPAFKIIDGWDTTFYVEAETNDAEAFAAANPAWHVAPEAILTGGPARPRFAPRP